MLASSEPPSTPPEQAEEPQPEPGSSPANQREQHQKKNRRRSSGIPPMNFNNPDDLYSSSPLSADNQSPGDANESDESDEDDIAQDPEHAQESEDSSQSSAKLDAALRQASTQAGTQKLDFEEDGDMTMDIAEDEVTVSFKPWARKATVTQADQENVDVSSPAAAMSDDGDDMTMDMTHAVGRIVTQDDAQSSDMDDDMSMELTMPLGSIKTTDSKATANRRKSLKRRVSNLDASQGSPAKRPASRRTSLRQRRQSEENVFEDATMDLTMAIGAIKTVKPVEPVRRASVDTAFEDATMDFTLAVGSIKNDTTANAGFEEPEAESEDEDLSMEFTKIVGPGIKRLGQPTATPEQRNGAVESAPMLLNTPTPHKSPRKSPGSRRSSVAPTEAQATPTQLPSEVTYPNLDPGTPEIVRQQNVEDIEPSPFVRPTPQSTPKANTPKASTSRANGNVSTPTSLRQAKAPMPIPDDPIAAPILNRRRSSLSNVQFSPLNAPREEPLLKSTALLTNNIKLLSTPRKQTLLSPTKRAMTPKTSQTPQKQPTPKQKTPTPKKATPRKSMSPKKRVVFGEPQVDEADEAAEEVSESDVERISLQDFLDMTKIRFMDLSTTKRRHTAAPALFHDTEVEEKEETLDRYVVAGACTLPEYELYQHACHEMKKYISDGRHFVRTMEANVMEENPLLFSEYLTAPPDQRIVMDNQFKNLKTNARLEARGEWYTWRSTLLHDLKSGLLGTLDGFKRDESKLANQEQLLDTVLPPLVEKQGMLSIECKQLQQRHDELNSCDREELEQTREKLVATDAELEEKRQLLERLRQDLADKDARIVAVKERKIECVEETKAAERVREECRGWSTSEVHELKGTSHTYSSESCTNSITAKVTALEQTHGWSIISASSASITMTHLNDLELYLQPSAFMTGGNTPNQSISLAYVGDSATLHPRPLTTSKRFFLQLIRAQLHCISQSQTRISDVLSLVKNGWATALAVADGVRWLEHNYITEEFILSDERMAISANMLLPTLQTKVKVTFEVGVSLSVDAVQTDVGARAEVVYGEKYGEEKMGAFLRDFCGSEVRKVDDMAVWADGMLDLAARLRKTGRKGERK
jgi:kinetochore protein Spc7/SPC105